MLFFLAGSEIDIDRIRGRVLNRSILGWLVALAAGLAVRICVGALLGYGAIAGVFIGIALTSTALGTIMPMLRDTGELHTPFGTAVVGIGAAGEFGPLIAISLFLSGRNPGTAALLLLAFALVAAAAIIISARGRHHHLHTMITTTLRTSGQFAVRFVLLIVAALVALSLVLGLDMLLGAFAAGLMVRFVLDDATPADRETVETKLEAVGFGLMVPVFFVVTGLRFDLQALTSNPTALLLLAVFALLLLLVRGLTGLFTAPSGASARDRRAIVLLAATGLPIIVAVTDIGTTTGDLPAAPGQRPRRSGHALRTAVPPHRTRPATHQPIPRYGHRSQRRHTRRSMTRLLQGPSVGELLGDRGVTAAEGSHVPACCGSPASGGRRWMSRHPEPTVVVMAPRVARYSGLGVLGPTSR